MLEWTLYFWIQGADPANTRVDKFPTQNACIDEALRRGKARMEDNAKLYRQFGIKDMPSVDWRCEQDEPPLPTKAKASPKRG